MHVHDGLKARYDLVIIQCSANDIDIDWHARTIYAYCPDVCSKETAITRAATLNQTETYVFRHKINL
jgi:hypothetical protein